MQQTLHISFQAAKQRVDVRSPYPFFSTKLETTKHQLRIPSIIPLVFTQFHISFFRLFQQYPVPTPTHLGHVMYRQNKTPTREEMLTEALAFQRDVSRAKDRHGHSQLSSQRAGSYGSGGRVAAGASRVSPQPFEPKLATPEQFFSRTGNTSSPQVPNPPAYQKPASRPMDNSKPMEVNHNPAASQDTKADRGLVGSRWATSVSSQPYRPNRFGATDADSVHTFS
jgi:hypothetical protein